MNECNYPTDVCVRFWRKVIIPKNYKVECWNYTGGLDKDGYGIFAIESDWPIRAHKFAYQYYNGPVKSECLMHTCDNPSCQSPYHIKEGTVHENNADRSIKGRSAIGSKGGNAKLTEDIVRQIRIDLQYNNYSHSMIKKKYGIGTSNASRIRRYEIWKHVVV